MNIDRNKASLSIGVIVINFNGGYLLKQCLECLLSQTTLPHSIVVIDNASEDDSLLDLPNSSIVIVKALDRNIGFAAANNIGIACFPEVDFILTINPDAFMRNDCIKELVKGADDSPHYDSFACRMMSTNTILDGAGDSYHFSGLIWRSQHGKNLREEDLIEKQVFSPCAGAALYRRSALDEVGGFDENFFCYAEDIDLGYRLKIAGKRCLYVPDAVVDHIGSAISDKYPGFAVYHGHRNLAWVFVKNTPAPLLVLMLPLHLTMTLVLFFVFLVKGQSSIYLRAKKDAIKGLPRVWRQRKDIQKMRKISLWRLMRSFDYSLFRK